MASGELISVPHASEEVFGTRPLFKEGFCSLPSPKSYKEFSHIDVGIQADRMLLPAFYTPRFVMFSTPFASSSLMATCIATLFRAATEAAAAALTTCRSGKIKNAYL